MSDKKAHMDLINHLQDWVLGLPDSKVLLPLLEMRFTPEDAEFLSKIPFLPHTAEQLSMKLGIPVDKLVQRLDALTPPGFVFRAEGKTAVRYALNDTIFLFYRMPGWLGKDDEWNRKIAPLLNQYYIDAMANNFAGTHTKGLRAIPINETIKDTRMILPYEDVIRVLDQVKYYTVSHCACRHRKNVDPDSKSCKHETENCLHFDLLGHYIVDNGMGREITREETEEILASAADAGLVHGISNTSTKMDTICNCCSCCCLFLESTVKMPPPVPRGHQVSNYIVEIDREKCKVCGLCAKRCPMGAIELKDKDYSDVLELKGKEHMTALELKGKELVFHPDKCLGCGVCVHKCTGQALSLKHRDDDQDFPKDLREQGQRILTEAGFDAMEIYTKNSPAAG